MPSNANLSFERICMFLGLCTCGDLASASGWKGMSEVDAKTALWTADMQEWLRIVLLLSLPSAKDWLEF